MKTKKHPKDLTDLEAAAIVAAFDDIDDAKYDVADAATLAELRAAAAARRDAEERIETAAIDAHRAGLSWGVIGAQLGMTRQGARQRFERLTG
jgi:predicted DNA-binding transcriptional regulator YafY